MLQTRILKKCRVNCKKGHRLDGVFNRFNFCSFLHDPSYKEIIENSSTFNSRLCAERRMRMPFIDTQTGKLQIIDFVNLATSNTLVRRPALVLVTLTLLCMLMTKPRAVFGNDLLIKLKVMHSLFVGVAQSHCNLFMTKRQRMPGQKEGQVYTYPAQR